MTNADKRADEPADEPSPDSEEDRPKLAGPTMGVPGVTGEPIEIVEDFGESAGDVDEVPAGEHVPARTTPSWTGVAAILVLVALAVAVTVWLIVEYVR